MARTPSRTDLEKMTPEEIVEKYGEEHWFVSYIKSLSRHDSDRNRRNRAREEKALRRKGKRK